MATLFSYPVSVRQALRVLTGELQHLYHHDEAKAIAWQALEHVLQTPRVQLLTRQEAPLAASQTDKLTAIAGRLLRHEPLQYITGEVEFLGLKLKVAPGVLIPRSETEELAQLILAENKHRRQPKVLDIGTGSGCLALALKSGLAGAGVHAVDISETALQIAESNAKANNLEVHFHQADILQPEQANLPTAFDIVVSNPPYVLQSEEDEMLPNVLKYEPHLALFVPDNDPLRFYSAIARFAARNLNTGGSLYFETNRKYAGAIGEELKRKGFARVQVLEDMYGNPRFVSGMLNVNKLV